MTVRSTLLEFVTSCVYLRGDNNVVSDCLFRNAVAVSVDLFDLKVNAEEIVTVQKLPEYKEKLRNYS